MNELAWRLARLEGIALTDEDRAAVIAELEEIERCLPLLAEFARDVPFPALPARPDGALHAEWTAGTTRTLDDAMVAQTAPARPADLCALEGVELAALLASRSVSSVEAVEAALMRLAEWEGRLNAFITVLPEQALAAAQAADAARARGEARGPWHGVPVTLKDMFDTAGVLTTGGSKLCADRVPTDDSALVARLQAAGAIVLGKTNLDEFGHGGTSTLSHYGPVHNPWHPERIAGGSSGGSAAAVAVGIGPVSYGTETGSSVRRPAAYCGIVGFKPTFGVLSRTGSYRGAWSMDHVGVFGRSVRDAAVAADLAVGYDPRDPASVSPPAAPFAARLTASVRGRRVGILPRFLETGAEPEVPPAFAATVDTFKSLGAEVRELDVPELSYAALTSFLNSAAESAANNRAWMLERSMDYITEVRRHLAAGLGLGADEYLTVQRARYRIAQAVRGMFEEVDLLVAPTTVRVAPPIAEGPRGNGDQTFAVSHNQSNLLRLVSMLGLPVTSLPCGVGADNLPLAIQIVGPWFADQRVLDASAAYTAATPWLARRPTLA